MICLRSFDCGALEVPGISSVMNCYRKTMPQRSKESAASADDCCVNQGREFGAGKVRKADLQRSHFERPLSAGHMAPADSQNQLLVQGEHYWARRNHSLPAQRNAHDTVRNHAFQTSTCAANDAAQLAETPHKSLPSTIGAEDGRAAAVAAFRGIQRSPWGRQHSGRTHRVHHSHTMRDPPPCPG
jgi:hypothetical protein